MKDNKWARRPRPRVRPCRRSFRHLPEPAGPTAGSTWTQTFGYDGFGNLTSKSTPSGSSELALPGVNPAKNWLTGYTYDLNGNVASFNNFALAYDPANRLLTATSGSFVETYGYDASNHRIERINSSLDTVYFFSPSGALLSEFNCLSTCMRIPEHVNNRSGVM
jgi:YD repeat-containing protein